MGLIPKKDEDREKISLCSFQTVNYGADLGPDILVDPGADQEVASTKIGSLIDSEFYSEFEKKKEVGSKV